MREKTIKVFYAVSTHWDREWYKAFQGFRYDLVKVTDNIIDALKNDKLDVFTFDGQTIVLEDYLEIRPQNKEILISMIKSGKLKVGPWYVMPDEFLVSGESIIRNFLVGKKIAEDFGAEPWKYGYINDIFGHIAQMPQILSGFGIKSAYLGRGLGSVDRNYTNFIWEAPDGSDVFGYKDTYGNLKNGFIKAENRENNVLEYIENKVDNTGAVILLYTNDHGDIDENLFDFIRYREALPVKYELIEGLEHLSEHLENFKGSLRRERGELIITGETEKNFRAVPNSISSYYSIKCENDLCEDILENKLSPLLVMAKTKGFQFEKAFYDLAYKYLLKNQPHDSICGCSNDTVHEDMFYRYSQIRSISSTIEDDFKNKLTSSCDVKEVFPIHVLNYGVKKSSGVFVTDIKFDVNWQYKVMDNARYQLYNEFSIIDENGNKVNYQVLNIEKNVKDSERPYIMPHDIYTVAIESELKPFGETKFMITGEKNNKFVKNYSDGELKLDNEFLEIEILSDGNIVLKDKQSGRKYKNLNVFVDDGEIGNGWFSERPVAGNSKVVSRGTCACIELVQQGELKNTVRITKHMRVPKKANYNEYRRDCEYDILEIISEVSVIKGSKTVEFETIVNNSVKDHRLRVEFPTGIQSDNYYASQAFTFIERQRGITQSGANYAEPENYEKNTSGIICVKDEDAGLSFVSKEGIHECGVSKSGVISAVMLRGFGRIMHCGCIKSEKAQLIGNHVYRYGITLETNFSKLYDIKHDLFLKYENVISNADSESALELKGNVCCSIIKVSENEKGIILRVFNPENKTEKLTVDTKFEYKNIYETDLAENILMKIGSHNSVIFVDVPPHKIKTLYFEM